MRGKYVIEDFQIRVEAQENLVKWGEGSDGGHYDILASLYGLRGRHLPAAMRKDRQLAQRIDLLNGPNGYVIYKMLKARMSK